MATNPAVDLHQAMSEKHSRQAGRNRVDWMSAEQENRLAFLRRTMLMFSARNRPSLGLEEAREELVVEGDLCSAGEKKKNEDHRMNV